MLPKHSKIQTGLSCCGFRVNNYIVLDLFGNLSIMLRFTSAILAILALTLLASQVWAGSTTSITRVEDNNQGSRLSKKEIEAAAAKKKQEFPDVIEVDKYLRGDVWVAKTGQTIKLIGIDVPTADPAQWQGDFYGKAALDYVSDLLKGKQIKLTYDAMRYDGLGRLLVYASLGKIDLNAHLVRRGLAMAACTLPNASQCKPYAQYQQEAMRLGRGMWTIDKNQWPEPVTTNRREQAEVLAVIDGDTVKLRDGRLVRYLAIDAAEDDSLYEDGTAANAAYELNSKLVEGKTITLEYDIEEKDPRGRTLAYVYVDSPNGEIFVNKELLRAGVAWVAVFPPNINRVGELLAGQQEARNKKIGLWSSPPPAVEN